MLGTLPRRPSAMIRHLGASTLFAASSRIPAFVCGASPPRCGASPHRRSLRPIAAPPPWCGASPHRCSVRRPAVPPLFAGLRRIAAIGEASPPPHCCGASPHRPRLAAMIRRLEAPPLSFAAHQRIAAASFLGVPPHFQLSLRVSLWCPPDNKVK